MYVLHWRCKIRISCNTQQIMRRTINSAVRSVNDRCYRTHQTVKSTTTTKMMKPVPAAITAYIQMFVHESSANKRKHYTLYSIYFF